MKYFNVSIFRFNSLLREEEKEILFWKGMENKNRVDANISRSGWKEKLEDSVGEDGNDDSENHSSKKMDGSSIIPKNQQSVPSSKSNDEHKKDNKRSQNAKVEKEDNKTKQTQRKEYERKERQSDAFRKGRRLKKERQGGFIPGTGN